ncbi:hypothetical protein KY363_01045 [Candidatus Woesearchaeota archaeon]|nr:hypothetical protein [Candidatus Woesearchaeota archaeon]
MNAYSIDRIIETVEELPKRLPGVSEQFVSESRSYWQAVKKVFFDKAESPYYSAFTRFRDFDDYMQWYAQKAYPRLSELNRTGNVSLKTLVKYVFRIYDHAADSKVIAALPLKVDTDNKLYMLMPDSSKVVV